MDVLLISKTNKPRRCAAHVKTLYGLGIAFPRESDLQMVAFYLDPPNISKYI
jgi:hypothetical protein